MLILNLGTSAGSKPLLIPRESLGMLEYYLYAKHSNILGSEIFNTMLTKFVVAAKSDFTAHWLRLRMQVHKAGGTIVVDSTFGPPPLQDPLKLGADWYVAI
jgi:hypothetical protein